MYLCELYGTGHHGLDPSTAAWVRSDPIRCLGLTENQRVQRFVSKISTMTAEPITSRAPGPALPPQPSEPTRAQTTGNALPNQTARPISARQQEVASSPRPTETLGRNETNQPGSNTKSAPATPPAAPAPQSPPPSTTEPPRQLVTYSQLGIYT